MNYRVELAVVSEQKQFCRFGLTLHNLSDQDVMDWSLEIIVDRYIQPDSINNASVVQIGSNCTITPNNQLMNSNAFNDNTLNDNSINDKVTNNSILKANQHFYCEFSVNTAPLRFYTDGLKDAVLTEKNGRARHQIAVTPIALASPFREREVMPKVDASALAVIPKPNHMTVSEGRYNLYNNSQITLHSTIAEKAANWLEQELTNLYQFKMNSIGKGDIVFRSNPLFNEGVYHLTISKHGVILESGSSQGFVHASATLLQLVQVCEESGALSLPYVHIVDQPRFKYRGMMLDCARHFHSVAQVKSLINHLAHYKFNTFHWHLTDDEGWRVEINAFPELTDIGAWRGHNKAMLPQYSDLLGEHGGFYSQQEIRDIISYADDRGITIIPEIDVPGHCRAAILSLPDLLVDTQDRSEFRSIQHYSDNVLSPALEGTYQFLDKVLEEVSALFPAPWVHIGADEVPDGVWVNSPKCQELMKQHNYQETKELQGHLLRYAEQKLRSFGKRMVGWEEAQHGNKVSKDTVIYSWLSEDAALKCAKQGFDVILQPAQTTYLDMTQDYAPEEPGVDWASVIPLEQAYQYEPLADVPDTDPIRKRILGIQCALWSEIITHQQRMDYMVFPRLTAMAEACWTEKSERDWTDYLSRLKGHLPLLDKQQVNYRNPWK